MLVPGQPRHDSLSERGEVVGFGHGPRGHHGRHRGAGPLQHRGRDAAAGDEALRGQHQQIALVPGVGLGEIEQAGHQLARRVRHGGARGERDGTPPDRIRGVPEQDPDPTARGVVTGREVLLERAVGELRLVGADPPEDDTAAQQVVQDAPRVAAQSREFGRALLDDGHRRLGRGDPQRGQLERALVEAVDDREALIVHMARDGLQDLQLLVLPQEQVVVRADTPGPASGVHQCPDDPLVQFRLRGRSGVHHLDRVERAEHRAQQGALDQQPQAPLPLEIPQQGQFALAVVRPADVGHHPDECVVPALDAEPDVLDRHGLQGHVLVEARLIPAVGHPLRP